MFSYAASRATADRLIRSFGQSATLNHTSSAAGANPWDPPVVTTTAITVYVVAESYRDALVDGATIKAGDVKVTLSALGLSVVPLIEDTLTLGSDVYSFVDIKPLSPGGTVVLYEIQARK